MAARSKCTPVHRATFYACFAVEVTELHHDYAGNNYVGHSYVGHGYIDRNYIDLPRSGSDWTVQTTTTSAITIQTITI